MKELKGTSVALFDGDLRRREEDNRTYLMKLKNEHLLFNYNLEAGRYGGRGIQTDVMGGWEASTCQIRGHFLGHWLSAAAIHYDETKDEEIKAKADALIAELKICQQENGGEWAAPIPEKYLYWIAKGKNIWAPQYNIHKLFMGLVDVYRYLKNEQALEIADKMADWFLRWCESYTKEQFMNILDVETGGMMEVWCDLYEITGKKKYETLMECYYRSRLFEPLLEGKDVLTNMHANTTIPEVLGCARAYEVTGVEKWMDIVKAYWKCAVTDRGCFVTGGQTQGEIWTPMRRLKARLGDKNQEHCTVYNMIRLAEFLFRCTKDPAYMDYIEVNVRNGILTQTYWRGMPYQNSPGKGLLTYFLPLKAGSRKDWAGEMDSFFCCHGTMVQANAALNRNIYYQEDKELYVTQYVDSKADFVLDGKKVSIEQREDHLNGSVQTSSVNDGAQHIGDINSAYANKPDFKKHVLTIHTEGESVFTLKIRIPDWINKEAEVYVNDQLFVKTKDTSALISISRSFTEGDRITVILPIGLKFVTLIDDETMGAFRYGPDVLAGVCEQERVLKLQGGKPEDELSMDTERQWGSFQTFFKTETQDPGINFKRLCEIGYEPYQVYFKVR
ncbi:MAG TPA: beta-L-arabinofuranosidase domain-containing protein [Lachnospiraceae bacterium]|nr:beta-L-arabinofuranosidase domain-containing protein [Lachnospiraceae bacterium]